MPLELNAIDPDWAWRTFEPSDESPWNDRLAAHLLRRAAFGGGRRELDAVLAVTPAEAVRRLVYETREPPELEQTLRDLSIAVLATGNPRNLTAWWLYRLSETPAQLREKMTLFWHGHFATGADKVTDIRLMFEQNQLLRRHALGSFSELVHDVSKDPAMLLYLDSATNRKAHPNENFAREVMELFCLGEGLYTEKDVQELARCFTGWEIRNEQFRFNRFQHDDGEKSILGRTGPFGGEAGIDIVLEQESCPRFLVAKLMRYFLFDEPEPPAALVDPLARDFRASGFQTAPLIERMLSSNLFFSDHCLARKIRSPLEFVLGILRGLESRTDAYALRDELEHLGQMLFYPPNVKGWDGGRAWIDSSTLLARANLVRQLVDQQKGRFAEGEIRALALGYGVKSTSELVDWLLGLLVAVPIPDSARAELIQLTQATMNRGGPFGEVVHALSTLPEFHLG